MAVGKDATSDPIISRLVEQDKVPWYRKPNLRGLYILMFPCCIGVEMTSGYDASMLNGLQAVATWQEFFHNPTGSILGLISAMYSLGAICALPFVPPVSDRLGRRMSIVFGSVLMVIGASLQCASQNFAMFVMARFVLGLGIPFAIVGGSSLIGELSYPKERPIIGSLFNTSYFIGAIVAAGVTLGTFGMSTTWGWRIPSLLQIVPSSLQIIFMYWMPESPRWLIAKGRREEAYAILTKYHAEGDYNSEFVKAEFAQIEQTLALEQELSKASWIEMFKPPGMRRRVVIGSFLGLFTQWSGNGLTSYFLSPILKNVGIESNRTINIVNLGITCWSLVNAGFWAVFVHKMPRRTAYMVCTISLTIVFTGWTVASAEYASSGSQSASIAVVALIFLYGFCYNIGYNALTYTYLVELFPFQARARGITIFQWWGRGAGFFNQFVNPIGIGNAGWKYYISYCVFLCFEVGFVYFMFPETNNRTLEELAFLFEGDKVRKEQAERVEQEIQALDNDVPIMAGQAPTLDKFGHDHDIIEHIDKI